MALWKKEFGGKYAGRVEQHEQNQKGQTEVIFGELQRSVQVECKAYLEEGRADHSGTSVG